MGLRRRNPEVDRYLAPPSSVGLLLAVDSGSFGVGGGDAVLLLQKYQYLAEDSNLSVPSEPSSPQSSPRTRSPSPDDILERVAADVKEYERENVDTFEASVKAKHNLMTVEQSNGASGSLWFPPWFSRTFWLCCFIVRGWGRKKGAGNVAPAGWRGNTVLAGPRQCSRLVHVTRAVRPVPTWSVPLVLLAGLF